MGAGADIGKWFMDTRYSYPVGQRGWHQRKLASFLGMIAACFLAQPLMAGTHPGGPAITPEQARLAAPFVELGAIDSAPGDSLDAFVLKAASVLHDFTQTTGHEACGVLTVAQSDTIGTGGPWRVRLTTNRSHIACVLVAYPDEGYRRLGPGIHSHPYLPDGFDVNPQDERWRQPRCKDEEDSCRALLASAPKCGDAWRIFDDHFSERDLQHGPGYLVARGTVLYQHGKEYPFRMLGRVNTSDPQPLAFNSQDNARISKVTAAVAAWQGNEADHIPAIRCDGPGGRHRPRL